MKKLFFLLLTLSLLSALLCGCGSEKQTDASADAQTESQTQTETDSQEAGTEGQPADAAGNAEDGQQAETAEGAVPAGEAVEKETVALSKDSAPEVKDQYKLSGVSADSGAAYSYLKSTESDSSVVPWEGKEGCTPVAVRVTVENQQAEAVNYLDNIGCTIVSDGGKIFIATAMQENPGQVADDGKTYPCVKSVPLEKGQSAVLWMIANVPTELLNGSEGLHAFFMLDNGSMYDVDLRAVM